MLVRPMTPDDVPFAEQISADAFYGVDLAQRRAGDPEPERRPAARSGIWIQRTTRFLDTDAAGCWVAENDGAVVGFATSIRRERVWCLATFAVQPGLQGKGVGARLLAAAESHAQGTEHAMLAASDDPRALRRYHAAGFALHPQMILTGDVGRSALPVSRGLREGTDDDRAWLDEVARSHRGGPHGPDHEAMGAACRLVVADNQAGFAYTQGSGLALLAARDETTARNLLVECLAGAEGRFTVDHVTSANLWAVDLGLTARLDLGTRGYLGVRGMTPPSPYIHHGALL